MKKYFRLYSCIIPVKGFTQTLLLDTNRHTNYIVPNDLYDIITHDLIDFENLKELYSDSKHIIIEYQNYLLKYDLIFELEESDLDRFPKIDTSWSTPYKITNMIIDIGEYDLNLEDFSRQIGLLGTEALQIRLFDSNKLSCIKDIVDHLNSGYRTNKLNDIQISISINDDLFYSKENRSILKWLDHSPITSSISLYRISLNAKLPFFKNFTKLRLFDKEIKDEKSCGEIHDNINYINNDIVFESLNFNSCLNCKLSIDKHGNIKNCPSMPQSFGNIKDTSFEKALSHPDFKSNWNLTKDHIEVCKDCEFRYICTDCRAYTERTHTNKEGLDVSKPLKCGYNPYTGEFMEWKKDKLKQNAIEYYGF